MIADAKRVKEIFLVASEQADATSRMAYLNSACAGDSKLRDRVEALLGAHDSGSSFLLTPAVAFPELDGIETFALPATPVPESQAESDNPQSDHDEESRSVRSPSKRRNHVFRSASRPFQ